MAKSLPLIRIATHLMNNSLSTFTADSRPPVIDDHYRESIAANAETILNTLFDSLPLTFLEMESINVLVIGAGFFPTFKPFIDSLSKRAIKLTHLKFILVEPQVSETDRFDRFFKRNGFDLGYNNINISYTVHNQGIKRYLKSAHKTAVDIIYFEHPDLSPIGILFAKNGHHQAKLTLSLRESVPYLKEIVQPHSIIIASGLFKRDITQLNALINFSLRIPTHRTQLPGSHTNGSPYNYGLISINDTHRLPDKNPRVIAQAIRRNDTYYSLLLIFSFILFLSTPPVGKIPSLLMTLALMFYHRYGIKNLGAKLILIAIQLSILIISTALIEHLQRHAGN
jgi:hypothetical protein